MFFLINHLLKYDEGNEMLLTYTIYLYVLSFAFVIAFCYEHSKSNFKTILWIILFLSLWVPAAIRYGVGTDYYRYISMVDSVRLGYISTELGYYLINYIVVATGIASQWAVAISSFLVLMLCLKSIPNKYFSISVFVLVCTFYLPSFSLVRQAIAIAFTAYGVKKYIDGSKRQYLILVICGSFFHLSALVLLPFYLLSKFRVSRGILILGVLFISITVFLGGSLTAIINSEFLAQSKYGYYATSNFVEDAKIGSGLGVIIKMLLPLAFIINLKNVLRLNPNLNILVWISVGCVIANICSMKIQIFNRLADVFLFCNFIVLPYFLQSINKNILRKITILAVILIFFVFYVRTIQANYNNDLGGIGISPYNTIFSN